MVVHSPDGISIPTSDTTGVGAGVDSAVGAGSSNGSPVITTGSDVGIRLEISAVQPAHTVSRAAISAAAATVFFMLPPLVSVKAYRYSIARIAAVFNV